MLGSVGNDTVEVEDHALEAGVQVDRDRFAGDDPHHLAEVTQLQRLAGQKLVGRRVTGQADLEQRGPDEHPESEPGPRGGKAGSERDPPVIVPETGEAVHERDPRAGHRCGMDAVGHVAVDVVEIHPGGPHEVRVGQVCVPELSRGHALDAR